MQPSESERASGQKPVPTLTQRTVGGAGWSALANISRQVLAFAGVAVLARQLGPGAYGLMGMAATATSLLANFRDLGTAAAVIQRPTVNRDLLCSLFWVNLGFGALLTVTVALASGPVAWFFHTPQIARILQVLSLSFLVQSAGTVHNALLNREMRLKATAMVDAISALAGYAVAIPMALRGFGVWSLVTANLVSPLISTLLYWAASGWRPSLTFKGREIRSVAGFSLNLSGFGLVNYFARNADNVIVGRYLGAGPLGNYQMAYNLMMYPIQNVTSTLSQALLPAFAKIQGEDTRFADAYVRSCSLIALITFPLIAGMGIVAKPLVSAVLGPKWIPVVPIFQILAPVGVIQSVQSTVGLIYVAKGRTAWMLGVGMSTTAVFVAAFMVGVRNGTTGVAAAYGIAYVLVLYPALAVPFRMIGLPVAEFARKLGPQLAITGAMVLACGGFQWLLSALGVRNAWAQLLSTVGVGVVTYVSLMRWFQPPAVYYAAETFSHLDLAIARRAASLFRRMMGA
ncbi:MAG: MOP flippase family protein [Acidobacteria bacterium]|nr:MOP flippase family protein [Acidobacteriota bacterium]